MFVWIIIIIRHSIQLNTVFNTTSSSCVSEETNSLHQTYTVILFFFISSFKCGVVLFLSSCATFDFASYRSLFIFYWNIYISQLQIQQMICESTLQIRKHEYFGDLGFIILFIGILSMYVINLSAVSLFADSLFMFLAMFVSDVHCQFEWMNIILFLWKKTFIHFVVFRVHMSNQALLYY